MGVVVYHNLLQKILTLALKACGKIGLCGSGSILHIPAQHSVCRLQ